MFGMAIETFKLFYKEKMSLIIGLDLPFIGVSDKRVQMVG